MKMKQINIDYDSTLVDYNNDMFKDINRHLKDNEMIVEIGKLPFHKNKHEIKQYISLKGEEGQKTIDMFFNRLNKYFGLENNEINLNNMSRRWQKIKKYATETTETTNLERLINEYMQENKVYKEITIENIGANEELINEYYKNEPMGYYKRINYFPGAIEFLKILKKSGYKINILTSYMSEDQIKYKDAHILNNIKDLIDEVKHTRQKVKYTKGYSLIDDSLKTILEYCKNNDSIGYLFNYKNQNNKEKKGNIKYSEEELEEANKLENFKYVSDYSEILSILNISTPLKRSDNTVSRLKN